MANIDDLLTRGVEHVYPSTDLFKAALLSGKKLKIYFGIDPTGPNLHIGHATHFLKLKELIDLGHEATILLGDFTAMIGDPDKKEARVPLTKEQIKANLKNYKKQISKIVPLAKIKIAYNSKWLGKLKFDDILELASEFTVGQMIERDMFQERIKANNPIYLHEFLYPLMQGYDSVALDTDVEVGASDQIFNMLAGRTMMKKRGKEKFVLANKLLVDATGKKMGKTEGNMVMLSDEPADIYGKVMSWPDGLMPLAYEICTRVDRNEYDSLIVTDPKQAKMKLASEITAMVHGAKKAARAQKSWVKTFSHKEAPIDVPEMNAVVGEDLAEVLLRAGTIQSKGEWRRLVEEGAVSVASGEKITDPHFKVNQTEIFKIGKKRFLKINI